MKRDPRETAERTTARIVDELRRSGARPDPTQVRQDVERVLIRRDRKEK